MATEKRSAIISDAAMRARPEAKDVWLIEPGARGEGRLVGRITPAGARSMYYRYSAPSGERVRLLIGPYDPRGDGHAAFTVQQARDRARDLSALYRSGVRDLRGHFARQEDDRRRALAAEDAARAEAERLAAVERERRVTVRALFDRWCSVDLKPHVRADGTRQGRKDGGEYARQQFERRVFPRIGDRLAPEVTRADLMSILDDTKAAGRLRTANVLLADLKQMFRFAEQRGIVDRDPLAGIVRRDVGGAETQRDRVLSAAELVDLTKRLPAARMNARSTAAVWLLLATGARIGELMGAVWSHHASDLASLQATADEGGCKVGVVDLDAGTWYLPDTKNQRDHTVHLSDLAVRLFRGLAALPVTTDDEKPVPWVFPNTARTGPVCVKSFGKQLADRQRPPERRMQGRAKTTDGLLLSGGRWTAHDLRRTAASLMAELGVRGDVIDECLNHVIESRVRRTYIRNRRPQEQARAFDVLGTHLEAIRSGTVPASNVVRLRTAAA
jgi:integrase